MNPTTDACANAWRRHRRWSMAANRGGERIAARRRQNLLLLTLGAIAGAVAAVTQWPRQVTGFAAVIATLALAAAGAVQIRFLHTDEVSRWAGARAASESIKAEVYRYLAGVSPYDDADRDERLDARIDQLHALAAGSLVDLHLAPGDDKPVPPVHDLHTYVQHRALDQANWHRARIVTHLRSANRLRGAELGVTAVAAVLSAIAAAVEINLAVWIGAATTIGAAFTAHLAATRHDRIAVSYAATVDQLDHLVERLPPEPDATTAARFVDSVERLLLAQNEGWVGLIQLH